MSKGTKTRTLIVLLLSLALVALMVFSILPESPSNGAGTPLGVLLRPFERLFLSLKEGGQRYFSALKLSQSLETENAKLKEENLALRLQIKENEQAALAYAELKEAFSLKDRYNQGRIVAANILEPPLDTVFDFYRLDIGRKDGLKVEDWERMAVMDEYASLVGRIYSADYNSAKLLPLTHEGFAVSCRSSKDKEWIFRVRGSTQLKTEGLLLADGIPANCPLQVGDSLITSGKGGVFPEGIKIGSIVEIRAADALGQKSAVVQPFVSLPDCHILFVLLPPQEEVGALEGQPQP